MTKGLSIINSQDACSNKGPSIHPAQDSDLLQAGDFRGRAAVVTLGCAKNQVDSEVMLGVLKNSGFEIVSDVERAEVVVVNTCGFLESAVNESIDCILDISELKKDGQLRKLIVAGCAVSRYGKDIKEALPEVDRFVSLDDILSVGQVATEGTEDLFLDAARPYFLYDETSPRVLSDVSHSAYVKISEGCNRPCTFCIIPTIRGPFRSRNIDSIINEVAALNAQGVREVNLVAQDLTAYGNNRKAEGLSDLLKALDSSKTVDWIRLLYAYPNGTDEQLLETIAQLPRVCNYLDIPLQHASNRVLKAMKRPLGKFSPRPFVQWMKEKQPEIAVRTTFIVGFPGETEEDIGELEAFVAQGYFSSVGVFTYSQEAGTPAAEMPGHVNEAEKEARRERIMEAQQRVVEKFNSSLIGKKLDVLIEGTHEESDLLLTGRTEFQAPEVDGVVILNEAENEDQYVQPGSFCQVEITGALGYDLTGKIL